MKAKRAVAAMLTRSKEGEKIEDVYLTEKKELRNSKRNLYLY